MKSSRVGSKPGRLLLGPAPAGRRSRGAGPSRLILGLAGASSGSSDTYSKQ